MRVTTLDFQEASVIVQNDSACQCPGRLRRSLERLAFVFLGMLLGWQLTMASIRYAYPADIPYRSAVNIPSNRITLVRQGPHLSAILPNRQDLVGIEYKWWRLNAAPGDTFLSGTGVGYDDGRYIDIGGISTEWSANQEGAGWLYFLPSYRQALSIAVTSETDIQNVDSHRERFDFVWGYR